MSKDKKASGNVYEGPDGAKRKETGKGVPAKQLSPVQRIFDGMHDLAIEWETLTGGAAFFELVTKAGAKVKMATKNSKRKL